MPHAVIHDPLKHQNIETMPLGAFIARLLIIIGFAPLTLPRLAEAVGAALACIVVNDVIGLVWRHAALVGQTARNANVTHPIEAMKPTEKV